MNDNASSTFASSSTEDLTAEEISRRAYNLWEQEGRPESRDLEHWLRAEQELRARLQSTGTSAPAMTAQNNDTQPLKGTRAAAAAAREVKPDSKPAEAKPALSKRNGAAPVSSEKVTARSSSSSRVK